MKNRIQKTCNVPPIDSSESVESVRLVPYLQHHYAPDLLDSVCLVKVDTEVVLCNVPSAKL